MAEYGKAQAQISVKGAPRKPRAASGRAPRRIGATVKMPSMPRMPALADILKKIL